MLSSTGKLPSWSSKHLKLTPGPFIGKMTSLALVNINPFTLESRKQFLKSNGKRKTQGDLKEAGPEKRRQGRTSVPCQETCCMRNQHGYLLHENFGRIIRWEFGYAWSSCPCGAGASLPYGTLLLCMGTRWPRDHSEWILQWWELAGYYIWKRSLAIISKSPNSRISFYRFPLGFSTSTTLAWCTWTSNLVTTSFVIRCKVTFS